MMEWVSWSCRSCRNWINVITAVTNVANVSAVGNAAHTPFSPKCGGRIISIGIMNITWRVRLMNIDFPAYPSDWKKLVETIWKPATQNIAVVMCRLFAVAAISTPSVVNARAMRSGIDWHRIEPTRHITDAAATEIQ